MKEEFLLLLGKTIRVLREKLNLSQEELGFRAELHRTYIGMIERGEKNISILNLQKIADALGVKLQDIIKLTEDEYYKA